MYRKILPFNFETKTNHNLTYQTVNTMKRILLSLSLLTLLFSCDLLTKQEVSSTSVGGDTNLDNNKVGYSVNPSVVIGTSNFTSNSSIVVTNNDNGVVTMTIKSSLPGNISNMIPASYKDATGKLNTTMKYKNTSEGILDYTNKDGKPFVIINYSSNVGDKYVLTKSDGTIITRTVTAKSATDDYPVMGGFMYIKTMTVEQDSRIPGISKIIYIANHKYGLVAVKVVTSDGTTTKISLM